MRPPSRRQAKGERSRNIRACQRSAIQAGRDRPFACGPLVTSPRRCKRRGLSRVTVRSWTRPARQQQLICSILASSFNAHHPERNVAHRCPQPEATWGTAANVQSDERGSRRCEVGKSGAIARVGIGRTLTSAATRRWQPRPPGHHADSRQPPMLSPPSPRGSGSGAPRRRRNC